MKASHILMAAVLALGALVGAAHAQVETTFVHVNTVDIGGTGYNVYDMMVSVEDDWTNSQLETTLTSGHFYNTNVYGRDYEPNPLFYMVFPELEWDTCAAVPFGYSAMAAFTPGSQFGQVPAGLPFNPVPPPGNTQIEAGWFDTMKTGPGTHKIARITISADANGDITGKSYDANPGSPDPQGKRFDEFYIAGGVIVPEPATLSLLAMGALAVLRRRKR